MIRGLLDFHLRFVTRVLLDADDSGVNIITQSLMSKVLIIGAGGVGRVVTHKCAQLPDVFGEIMLASRTKSKCDGIAAELKRPIQTAGVNADNVPELVKLLKSFRPEVVINVALPYQDLTIMDACLAAGVNYMDTANYEPKDVAKFEYHWQWAYQDRFKKAGLTALLGCGFDPGVTNVYTAYALKHHFSKIDTLRIIIIIIIIIIDCNAGDHGKAFATNFNPEINLREVTASTVATGKTAKWVETKPLEIKRSFSFPAGIGPKNIYCLYHEELESLTTHIPMRRARFWMTFGDNYIKHMEVLVNVGMTRIDPVKHQGVDIIPIEFLKTLLPEPGTLGADTKEQDLHRQAGSKAPARTASPLRLLRVQHLRPPGVLSRNQQPGRGATPPAYRLP